MLLFVDLCARGALAAVYAVAGIAKLTTARSARGVLRSFELDPRLLPAVAVMPLAELAVTAGLVVDGTSRWAALASCALLLLFSALIARNVRRGRDADCNCFGALHASRTDRRALARNGVLLALSLLASAFPTSSPVALPVLTAWLAAAVVVAVAVRARAGAAVAVRQASAPSADTTALRTYAAAEQRVRESGRPVVAVFVDPDCRPCRSALPVLERWWPGASRGADLLLVTRGSEEANRELVAAFPPAQVLVDDDRSTTFSYRVSGTPSAVVVVTDEGGEVASATVAGADAIEAVLRRATEPERGSRRLRRRGDDAGAMRRLRLFLTEESWTRGALSRRQMLQVGGAASLAAFVAACGAAPVKGSPTAKPTAKSTPKAAGLIDCPSCGTCSSCEEPASGAKQMTCGECSHTCPTKDLCTHYANENADHQKLVRWLEGQGFRQDGEAKALEMTRGGTLAGVQLLTKFTSSSSSTPSAFAVYSLTDSEAAMAAVVNAEKRVVEVAAVDSGAVKSGKVSPHPYTPNASPSPSPSATPSAPTPSATSRRPDGHATSLMVASCEDTCNACFNLITTVLLTTVLAAEFDPLGAALAFGFWAANAAGVARSGLETVAELGNILNSAIDVANDLLEEVVCQTLCHTKLTACCNYTGACYDSDYVCESNCPGGLAHPGAHCDVHITVTQGG